ncbi:MAG: hypothetical protein ACC653_05040 [Gammaproteobacteria bacterium]
MNLRYKRKIHEGRDLWEECKLSSLRKGDIFYFLEGEQEGPFLTAKTDAELRPSIKDDSKIIWHIETEPMSDDNFL